MAYEKGVSIWEAKNELTKLKVTIETIQAVLNDAENKQEGSDAIKNWIQRLTGVLYDAEDLFDEVFTENLLKQQMMEGKNKFSLKNKVRVSCSKLNPIVSRNSIAKRVKAIRERLVEISIDMDQFRFVQGQPMIDTRRENYSARCSIDPKFVIGRDLDKDSILAMLFNDLLDTPMVIAICGIGGMGKTTLAHLIYNDKEVSEFFEERWFACISDSFDDKEVLGKIFQSICGENCNGLTLIQLEDKIRKSLKGKKYLLVLDDVWEEDHGKWRSRMSLLSSGANGSRIIVTTRLQSVVSAVGVVKAHHLKGLSEDDSWDLFKKLAFVPGYENDPRRESVGRDLLKRCRGLPLAIWCMGGLLYNKTIREWEEIERVGLPTLRGKHNDEVISILKLSYDHLPSNLKQCFTYCCLFPKDYRYTKEELLYHWVAQGYITLDEEESSFMYLLRMGFFQKVDESRLGEIRGCKMHDIMHDLALHLSGEESIMQDGTPLNVSSCTRYVSLTVDGEEGRLWDIPAALLKFKLIRSCMLRRLPSRYNQPNLDQLCSNFKWLRTLTLSGLMIKHIPPSIGELKLVRYLDLSWNVFERLPDSIADLVNLVILNLEGCLHFNVWPLRFKNLINLRFLNLRDTCKLLSMPEGIGGMVSLQSLTDFKAEKWSQFRELTELQKQLRDHLFIKFDERIEVGDERRWELPAATSLQYLIVSSYPGHGILGWGNNERKMKLEYLQLESCKNVKYLPSMSCLPGLKWLELKNMPELEYMEQLEEVNLRNPATPQKFFPGLKRLVLFYMPKLKGWRRKVATEATSSSSTFLEFSHLSHLTIRKCPNLELKAFPQCPRLRKLHLENVDMPLPSTIFCSSNCSSLEKIEIFYCKGLSDIPGKALTSLRQLLIGEVSSLKSLHLASPHLLDLKIKDCDELVSIELGQRRSLRSLEIRNCKQLRSLHIAGVEEKETDNWPLQQGLASLSHSLELENVDSVVTEWSLSSFSMSSLRVISVSDCKGPISLRCIELASLQECYFKNIDGLQSLHIPSPHLRRVSLEHCVGLTSVEVKAANEIVISCCSELKNVCIAQPTALRTLRIDSPSSVDWGSISNLYQCKCLSSIELNGVNAAFIVRLLSSSMPSLQEISIFKSIGSLNVALSTLETLRVKNVCGLKILNFKSPHLRSIDINNCSELTSVELESPLPPCSYERSYVIIYHCSQLNNVRIPRPIALQYLEINECPALRLSNAVDWTSLSNLDQLRLRPLPPVEEVLLQLPQCLLQRHAEGNFQIYTAY